MLTTHKLYKMGDIYEGCSGSSENCFIGHDVVGLA